MIRIRQAGYLYVYLSNEGRTTDGGNVYFDALRIDHTKGHILQEDHYYPFGANISALSSTAPLSQPNKYKFNGIEENTGFGLNTYDAFYRNYDPILGRWWQVDPKTSERESPYVGMANNPILYNDVLGDTTNYYDSETGELIGTLYGQTGMNDRTISRADYDRLMNERYILNNLDQFTIGQYNLYPHDPDHNFLGTNDMEALLNNAENVETSIIDLDGDVGQLARIGYAEFRGENSSEREAAMDIVMNRVDSENYPNTVNGVITAPAQFSSLRNGDPNLPFWNAPYTQAQLNRANYNAWTGNVTAALRISRGTSQGATLYYSPESMSPKGSKPDWDFKKLTEITVQGVRSSKMKIYREN